MGELASRVRAARTFLFVPGDRPERFAKAVASGADLVVLDLEDAVTPQAKDAARRSVGEFLESGAVAAVRINAVDTPWHADDVAMLAGQDRIVMLPKAERADRVAAVVAELTPGSAVVALVETARGVLHAAEVAEVAGVHRLALGTMDLGAELGIEPDDREAMKTARRMLVLASASAGLAPPVDGVTAAVDDPGLLEDDVRHARRLGLTGKLCIHPRQVPRVHETLRPTRDEIRWATAVLAAAEAAAGGPVLLEGRMVDKPVVDRARRIIDSVEPDPTTEEGEQTDG